MATYPFFVIWLTILTQPLSSTAQGSLDIGGQLKEGVKVQHERFGIGTVLQIEGSAPNQKVTVEFINSGKRQLLLKFAKLTVFRIK